MYENIICHLQRNITKLSGGWVSQKDNYETNICCLLEMKLEKSRYWDARWQNHYIEFKKGKSIWLDLVRYGEILSGIDERAKQPTISLFFIPDKIRFRIEEILCVETHRLIAKLNLTKDWADVIIQLNTSVPRQLNAQASLTVGDIKNISFCIIK